jgi:hypothetical protein
LLTAANDNDVDGLLARRRRRGPRGRELAGRDAIRSWDRPRARQGGVGLRGWSCREHPTPARTAQLAYRPFRNVLLVPC